MGPPQDASNHSHHHQAAHDQQWAQKLPPQTAEDHSKMLAKPDHLEAQHLDQEDKHDHIRGVHDHAR